MGTQKDSRCYICGAEIDHNGSDAQRGVLWGCEKCGKDFCEACFQAYCGAEALHSMTSIESDENILCPGCHRTKEHEDVLDHRIDAVPNQTHLLKRLGKMLFCGKRLDNGAWETGHIRIDASQDAARVYIDDSKTGLMTLVDPDTVGRYIGRNDIKGTRIFEGSIVKIHSSYPTNCRYAEVRWHPNIGKFVGMLAYGQNWMSADDLLHGEVVGNIHDNILLDRYCNSEL
jgi:DNA-directed RNA polymerase subunit RPC12/RpoP